MPPWDTFIQWWVTRSGGWNERAGLLRTAEMLDALPLSERTALLECRPASELTEEREGMATSCSMARRNAVAVREQIGRTEAGEEILKSVVAMMQSLKATQEGMLQQARAKRGQAEQVQPGQAALGRRRRQETARARTD